MLPFKYRVSGQRYEISMSEINLPDYATFKQICITTKNLNIQFVESSTDYTLYGPDAGGIMWVTAIPKFQDDAIDFETNVKSKANTSVILPGQIFTKPFDTIQASYPSLTQEVYTSMLGGVRGTVLETVTIVYTDSTKSLISSVVRE